MWTGTAVPYKIERNISIGICQSFIAQWRRIHFNSFSEAVFSRLTAIGKDFLVFSKWTTIKLSFLLVHIINGRNEVDLRLKCALFNLEFLASHSPFDWNLLCQTSIDIINRRMLVSQFSPSKLQLPAPTKNGTFEREWRWFEKAATITNCGRWKSQVLHLTSPLFDQLSCASSLTFEIKTRASAAHFLSCFRRTPHLRDL